MKWTTKAFIQRILSHSQFGEPLYYLGQRYVGGFRHFTIEDKLWQGMRLLECVAANGVTIEGIRTVEIGTGWSPIIPLLFSLNGQRECHTYDTARLLKNSLVIKAVKEFRSSGQSVLIGREDATRCERFEMRKQMLQKQINAKSSASEILESCGIYYHAPSNAASTGLADGSVDLLYSNAVLEHVPESEIHRLFAEAHRILHPGGYMVHLIDLNDHFSYSDPEISTINFLQFSEESFARYNSQFTYQNRLRAPAWHRIFLDHGFEITSWQARVDEKVLQRLPLINLHKSFKQFSAEELCTSLICVLARRPMGADRRSGFSLHSVEPNR
jgi:SAM-dependent methyltransferase